MGNFIIMYSWSLSSYIILVSHLSLAIVNEGRNREEIESQTRFPRPSKLLKTTVRPRFPNASCVSRAIVPALENPKSLLCSALELYIRPYVFILSYLLFLIEDLSFHYFLGFFPPEPIASHKCFDLYSFK